MPGSPGPALGAPACIRPVEVAHAKAVRIERNGIIVLADGRSARLEGVLLPTGASDHGPATLAQEAIAALADMTTNRIVDLTAVPPAKDRYGRIRAQVTVHTNGGAAWLQAE